MVYKHAAPRCTTWTSLSYIKSLHMSLLSFFFFFFFKMNSPAGVKKKKIIFTPYQCVLTNHTMTSQEYLQHCMCCSLTESWQSWQAFKDGTRPMCCFGLKVARTHTPFILLCNLVKKCGLLAGSDFSFTGMWVWLQHAFRLGLKSHT